MKNLILKQIATLGFIGSTILSTAFATKALTIEEVINPRQDNGGWVTDMADILNNCTETKLNNLITNLEQNNSSEIAVVTVAETASADSPKTFATELFNYWGIGKAESDNGILFLVSMEDKRVEIETGYGIEDILTDAEIAKIIHNKITPQYRQGNFDHGTLDGTKALISVLQNSVNAQDDLELTSNIDHEVKASLPNIQTSSFAAIFVVILVIWVFINIISNISSSNSNTINSRKRKKSSSSHNYYPGYDSSSSSDSSSFFRSGSSDSSDFGGGSSDGGGAGGDF